MKAHKRKKPEISQKRASFIGMVREVTRRGRDARRAACIGDQQFGFSLEHGDLCKAQESSNAIQEEPHESHQNDRVRAWRLSTRDSAAARCSARTRAHCSQ